LDLHIRVPELTVQTDRFDDRRAGGRDLPAQQVEAVQVSFSDLLTVLMAIGVLFTVTLLDRRGAEEVGVLDVHRLLAELRLELDLFVDGAPGFGQAEALEVRQLVVILAARGDGPAAHRPQQHEREDDSR